MRSFGFILLALAPLVSTGAGAADTGACSLKLVNTVALKHDNAFRPLVPVTINATEKQFLLDTGGAATQISAEAADELKLPTTESTIKLLDLYGNASTRAVKVDMFVLGRLGDKNTRLPVMTFRDNELFSGLLAADYMGRFEVELDFAAGKMNYFSPDHCPGKVVYWPTAAIAAVPMRLLDSHLVVEVSLDGHPFKAIVDTGATHTTLRAAEAKRIFGVASDDANKAWSMSSRNCPSKAWKWAIPIFLSFPTRSAAGIPITALSPAPGCTG